MLTLHQLRKQYMLKQVSEAEYRKQEERYLLMLLKLCYDGHISKEEVYKRVTGEKRRPGKIIPGLLSFMFMETFKVMYTMVCNFDLFFHHRHSTSKVIVFPHFPRKFFNFLVSYGLMDFQFSFDFSAALHGSDNHANESHTARD